MKKNVPCVSLQQAEVNMHLKQLLNEAERPQQSSKKEEDSVIRAAAAGFRCRSDGHHSPGGLRP